MNFQQALDLTLRERDIKGSELAAIIGCSQGQISQLRKGGECTLTFLNRLLEGLDKLGAKNHLMSLWHSGDSKPLTTENLINILQSQELSDVEIADLLSIASRQMRKSVRVTANVA